MKDARGFVVVVVGMMVLAAEVVMAAAMVAWLTLLGSGVLRELNLAVFVLLVAVCNAWASDHGPIDFPFKSHEIFNNILMQGRQQAVGPRYTVHD
jgi:hypothetical protein